MRVESAKPIMLVDIIGGLMTVACFAATGWLITVDLKETAARKTDLRQRINSLETELNRARREREVRATDLATMESALNDSGKFLNQVSAESYFQKLSEMATRHRLSVVSQIPLTKRTYPGIQESCYAVKVVGKTNNLVAFLHDIEEAQYWADVGYLSIVRGDGSPERPSDQRVATLTVSLFATAATEEESG